MRLFRVGALAAVVLSWATTARAEQIVELPATTNITVAAGETLRIEYLRGGTTLYKSGPGRLEVAVVANPSLKVIVSNGTFAVSKPTTVNWLADEKVIFHLDARAAARMTLREENGTNFITRVLDADGRTDRALATLAGRPDVFLVENGMNGLPVIDLGTLDNTAAAGYGAALAFDAPVQTACEILYVFEDDPRAKNRAKSIGPCFFGSAGTTMHVRGYVENGVPAPLHYASFAGRAQDGNFIDGVKYGTAKYNGLPCFYNLPVPDGAHLFRWKVSATTAAAFDAIAGLGYCSKASLASYGGLRIAEVLFLNATGGGVGSAEAEAFVEPYQTYLKKKWFEVTTVGMVTLLNDASLDLTAAPFCCQLQWTSSQATVVGGGNLFPKGYYEAGNPAVPVGMSFFEVPPRQTTVPNLSFANDAILSVSATASLARAEGTGTLVKKGDGALTLGAHSPSLASLRVEAGVLRLSPLEASGAWLHVDPADPASLTLAPAGGTNYVTKWVDCEHGATWLQKTTTQYQFANRSVGTPYVSDKTVNGLPVIDFGSYTSEVYPDGTGGAFVPSVSLETSGLNAPGMAQFFVIWGDYEEIADLPLYQGRQLRGPGILAGDDGWGYRGYGGGGATYPILGPEPNGSYHTSANSSIRIDGKSYDYYHTSAQLPYNLRPEKGFHLLDQQVGGTAPKLHYIGGCKWQNGYEGGLGSGSHPGVWGGVRMGEILIYRKILPPYFRERVAAALGAKWFARPQTVSYAALSVAPGATLAVPETTLEAQELTLGGTLSAAAVAASAVTVTAAAEVDGALRLSENATLTVCCGEEGFVPTLSAGDIRSSGSLTLGFTFPTDNFPAYTAESHCLLTGLAPTFSLSSVSVVLPSAAKEKGLRAHLSLRDGALFVDFELAGFSLIVL